MTSQILTIIQIIVTGIATVAYILTYRYLSQKVKTMEQTVTTMKSLIDAQNQTIQTLEHYKKLYDPQDFNKAMNIKLENQQAELRKAFAKEAIELGERITKGMNDNFMEANQDLLGMVQELIQFPIHATLQQFPDKAQKTERDAFIKQHYPHTADKLIGFVDAILAGQVQPNDPTK